MGGSFDGSGIDGYNQASVSSDRKHWAKDRTDELNFIGKVLAYKLLDHKIVTVGSFETKTLFLSQFSLKGPTSWRLEPTFDAHGRTSSFDITQSRNGGSMTRLYSNGETAQLVTSTIFPESNFGATVCPSLEKLTDGQDIRFVDRAVRLALGFVDRNVDLETRIQLNTPRGIGAS